MSDRIKVSCVSYLNSMPFIYGLQNHIVADSIELSLDIPSVCASKLIQGEATVGLVPVASIPGINNARVISDYCIAADGAVSSVLLFSDVPLQEISAIYLDYQSMTSVNLVKVLAGQYWNISPDWISAEPGFENEISGSRAGVIIGDRAIAAAGKYKYVFDLSAEWKQMTGLPFVFACWVSNKELSSDFINSFNQSLKFGLQNMEASILNFTGENISQEVALNYLKNFINYRLDDSGKLAMKKFLSLIEQFNVR